ncbi:hypothetical protein NMY22_g12508 [Coprinellus aureogranulatus]|nr:hypothetical protein NMY22_g12508 [Coprinellus aureogranulatus]
MYTPAKVRDAPLVVRSPGRPLRRLHPIYRSPSPINPSPSNQVGRHSTGSLVREAVSYREPLPLMGYPDSPSLAAVARRLFIRDIITHDMREGSRCLGADLHGLLGPPYEEDAIVEASTDAVLEVISEAVELDLPMAGVVCGSAEGNQASEACGVLSQAPDVQDELNVPDVAQPTSNASADELLWDMGWTAKPFPAETPEVQAPAIDEAFFASCRFYHYDPQRPLPTNLDILLRLGNYFGPGVTKAELRQALRRCKSCRHFLYTDTRSSHRCTAQPIAFDEPLTDLVSALLTYDENSGLTSQDMRRLLAICARCKHVVQSDRQYYHTCANSED